MINWHNLRYEFGAAERDFLKLQVLTTSMEPISIREEFKDLRVRLIAARDEVFEKHNLDSSEKLGYTFDLSFGLKVYDILNEQIGFTNRIASNDDIWRYLSICIVPDIVHSRWSLNEERYYKSSRRIWLKTIWWYIHLSWRTNSFITYDILSSNTTDTIQQLVERPGIGYHTELYREIMLQYNLYGNSSRDLFRRVLILNTARLITISPELVEDGVEGYVNDLFEKAKVLGTVKT
ncbi:MAG: hypothetical protein ABS917_16520 [Solibacillus sp.]|uniref:hypothetical protein n=1 Tax=Solibacillus sp. TaxID=1909654 RepID=UPI003315304A